MFNKLCLKFGIESENKIYFVFAEKSKFLEDGHGSTGIWYMASILGYMVSRVRVHGMGYIVSHYQFSRMFLSNGCGSFLVSK